MRPIAIVTIGVIFGIMGGMYGTKTTFLLFFVALCFIAFCMNQKQWRYWKVICPTSAVLLFTLSGCIAFCYTTNLDKRYQSIKTGETGEIMVTIKSSPIEKDYVVSYIAKVENLQNQKNLSLQLYLPKDKKKTIFSYGDKLKLTGELTLPEEARNTGGFNQRQYFKTKGLYGTIYAKGKIEKIGEETYGIGLWGSKIRQSIIEKVKAVLPEENANLLLAILIGEKEMLSDETITQFQNSSLIHILCVSGAHVSFFLLCVQKLCQRLGRRYQYGIALGSILFLISITGFPASVARACLMGSMLAISKLCFRRADTITTVAFSLLVLLIHNPFCLFDTGFLLSYGGTIGILAFDKILEEKIPKNCGKVKQFILKTVAISCSAQIILAPMIAYLFQSFHLTFFLSNLVATPLFEAILIVGYLFLLFTYFAYPISLPLASILNGLLTVFLKIAELSAKLPFAHNRVVPPSMWFLVIYYTLLLVGRYWYLLWQKKVLLRYIERKQKQLLTKIKEKWNSKKVISAVLIFVFLFQSIKWLPQEFSIYFIDVGQGDSMLIQTTRHKTIMIDSGGQEDLEKYDVGKQVLVPYLLKRGITKLDYILISHFHADHCNGFLAMMEELTIGTILMAKQEELNEEMQHILELAKQKQIQVQYVQKGQSIWIDQETKLTILYVGQDRENLNNHSIIAQIQYEEFSLLLTGDAEEKEEKEFLKAYAQTNLSVDILKVGHHGSSTSTTEDLLKKIKPQIALIGVGKNNNYGHPNAVVLERLKKQNVKVYRTDEKGEIIVKVKKNKKLQIDTKL